jgi:signal transduction histidine kinase
MFTWSLADFLALVFFFFSYYFLYVFISEKDLPTVQKIVAVIIILPTAIWTLLGWNLTLFDANLCQADENQLLTYYAYFAEALFLFAALFFTVRSYLRAKEANEKRKIALVGSGTVIFLGVYLSFILTATILVNIPAYAESAYNYEIYGLFGMPILLAYLSYLIVKYKAFNMKMLGAQALVLALVALIGSEFAFITSLTNQILVAITLAFVGVVGILLIRSVRREIEQRERIEKLATELQAINARQEVLFHFIGHEVKGFLTKDAGAFASLSEGDFGPLPSDAMKTFVGRALEEARRGADSVSNILKASNLKKGTVTYTKAPFDLKALVASAVEKARRAATEKGLTLTFTPEEGTYQMTGDGPQINDHVLRNLIDNAINYTPTGSVTVSLKQANNKFIFAVKDSGVGITSEDKARLFTEGGHGKDSQKVNAHSTGYGLYIAKQITEAHGGTISASSEGAGKGSTFVVELPVS